MAYLTPADVRLLQERAGGGDLAAKAVLDLRAETDRISRALALLQRTPGPQGEVGPTGAPGSPGAEGPVGPPGPAGGGGLYTRDSGTVVPMAVYLVTIGSPVTPTIAPSSSADADLFPCIGFVSDTPTGTTAVVTYAGEASGFTGLTPGATYYLGSTPGSITDIAPTSGVLQRIGSAKDATTLIVDLDRDYILL